MNHADPIYPFPIYHACCGPNFSWGFGSCSTSQPEVIKFLNRDGVDVDRVLFIVEGGSSARDVRRYSEFEEEAEVLMPFGSAFTVVTASKPDPDGTLLLVTLRQTSDFALPSSAGVMEPEPEPM